MGFEIVRQTTVLLILEFSLGPVACKSLKKEREREKKERERKTGVRERKKRVRERKNKCLGGWPLPHGCDGHMRQKPQDRIHRIGLPMVH